MVFHIEESANGTLFIRFFEIISQNQIDWCGCMDVVSPTGGSSVSKETIAVSINKMIENGASKEAIKTSLKALLAS